MNPTTSTLVPAPVPARRGDRYRWWESAAWSVLGVLSAWYSWRQLPDGLGWFLPYAVPLGLVAAAWFVRERGLRTAVGVLGVLLTLGWHGVVIFVVLAAWALSAG
ncbi:hypothetical protein OHS33_10590 [Streptomyces sp. NBC_00536]|uniref:hypothetical protein n=1 Tax=Streptomyces sp. NBC_00536 TaxID=2975769 RepID=UPI002E800913|nr:hypothetical protein [Streptomyces sp. NBC_00536]WUC78750.1 hypothetical protein OHS33_10590 [Streptomyces sp. NBC_00536]